MAQECLPAACVEVARIALVDDCTGAPIAGASNGYVTDCVRNVVWTTNVEEGDETVLKNDCGKKCYRTKNCDEVTNYTLEMQLLRPDAEFVSLITGWPLVNDGAENIGYVQSELVDCQPWLAVELFEQIPDEDCSVGRKYRRIVFPKVRFQPPGNEKEDPFRVLSLTAMSDASSLVSYGDGPFNDSPYDFSTWDADDTSHFFELYDILADAPDGQCGFIAVPAELP